MNIEFLNPLYLLIILFIPPLLLLGLLALRKTRKTLGFDGDQKSYTYFIIFLILTVLAVAISRPIHGTEIIQRNKPLSQLYILVDLSLSMGVADSLQIRESRIVTLRRKLSSFIDEIENGMPAQIGIVGFAGTARTLCPPTQDIGVLRQYLKVLESQSLSATGSSLANVFEEVSRSIQSQPLQRSAHDKDSSIHLIVLSDGEFDTESDVGISTLKSMIFSKPVHSIVIGSDEGGLVPSINNTAQQPIYSLRDLTQLQMLADSTNGQNLTATIDDSDVRAIIAAIKSSSKKISIDTESIEVPKELGAYLCLLSLFLLLLYAVVSGKGLSFFTPIPFILLLPAFPVSAQTLTSASDYYTSKDYERAYLEYKRVIEDKATFDSYFGAGSSAFRLGKYNDSVQYFEDAASVTEANEEQFRALFNAGNAHLANEDYEKAIKAYDRALAVIANEKKALFNKKLAEDLLKEKKEQSNQRQQSANTEDQEDKQKEEKSNKSEKKEDGSSDDNQMEDSEQDMKEQNAQQDEQEQSQEQKSTDNNTDTNTSEQQQSHRKDEQYDSKTAAKLWLDSLPEARVLFIPLEREMRGRGARESRK